MRFDIFTAEGWRAYCEHEDTEYERRVFEQRSKRSIWRTFVVCLLGEA